MQTDDLEAGHGRVYFEGGVTGEHPNGQVMRISTTAMTNHRMETPSKTRKMFRKSRERVK